MNNPSDPVEPVERQLCRLCLGKEEQLVHIFSVQHTPHGTEPLNVRIHGFLQLEVTQNDSLPQWICKHCLDKIDDFTNFRERCKLNQRKLLLGEDEGAPNDVLRAVLLTAGEDDEQSDDEETEMIVIDPSREYESSNDGFPNDSYGDPYLSAVGIGNTHASFPTIADEEENDGSEAEDGEGEDEEDEEEDMKCDTSTGEANRNGLTHVTSLSSTPQKTTVYSCKYCDLAFAASSACQLHEMQDHDLQAPYSCVYCQYKTSIRMSLITHIRDSHSIARPYICIQCNKGFLRRSDLKKHTFVHTGVRPYACDKCEKSFSRNTNLKKHMRTHLGLKPHACAMCSRSFANRTDLVRHRSIHLQQQPKYSCIRCGAGYTQKDKLYEHERFCVAKHPTLRSEPFFYAESKPETPFANHSPAPQAPSLVADPGRIDSVALTPAAPVEHSPQSSTIFSCSKCPKRFLSKLSLRAHQSTHSSEDTRQYDCPQCKMHIVGKREYDRHLLTHTDMKPFGCVTCGKRFSQKDKLHRHQRIHQRDKQFACPNCAAKFVKMDALTSHLKIHSLTMPASNLVTGSTTVDGQGHGPEAPQAMNQHSLMYSMDAALVDPSIRM